MRRVRRYFPKLLSAIPVPAFFPFPAIRSTLFHGIHTSVPGTKSKHEFICRCLCSITSHIGASMALYDQQIKSAIAIQKGSGRKRTDCLVTDGCTITYLDLPCKSNVMRYMDIFLNFMSYARSLIRAYGCSLEMSCIASL